jgi:hypothetical protein
MYMEVSSYCLYKFNIKQNIKNDKCLKTCLRCILINQRGIQTHSIHTILVGQIISSHVSLIENVSWCCFLRRHRLQASLFSVKYGRSLIKFSMV